MVANMFLRVLIIGVVVAGAYSEGETETCIACDSSVNELCATDPSKITDTCVKANKCFVRIDSDKVTRGCLATEEEVTCSSPSCAACANGDKCNDVSVCIACTSQQSASCAQAPNTVKTLALCTAKDTKCAITIDTDGNTVRRCATQDDVTKGDTDTSALCSTGRCNTDIIPKARLQCVQCQSSTEADCSALGTLQAKPCTKYVKDDKCFTHATSATSFTRGCVSEPVAASNPCSKPSEDNKCVVCNTDNCNRDSYTTEQKLKCVQCNSTSVPGCAFGPFTNPPESCTNPIPYNSKGGCYTQFHEQVVYRGCLYDRNTTLLSSECTEPNKCYPCTEDNCNTKTEAFSCIRCRSTLEPDCANNAKNLPGTACSNAVTTETAKCYHGIWSNVVIRGCLVDADERQQGVCRDEHNMQCILCEGANCNTEKSSAVRFAVWNVLAVVLPIAMLGIKTL